MAAQLGEGQEPGKQGRHRDQLRQDVRQLQHHVERQGFERIVARGDHLIAVGEEFQEQHERGQPCKQHDEATQQEAGHVASDDGIHVAAPASSGDALPSLAGRRPRSARRKRCQVPARSSANGSHAPSAGARSSRLAIAPPKFRAS